MAPFKTRGKLQDHGKPGTPGWPEGRGHYTFHPGPREDSGGDPDDLDYYLPTVRGDATGDMRGGGPQVDERGKVEFFREGMLDRQKRLSKVSAEYKALLKKEQRAWAKVERLTAQRAGERSRDKAQADAMVLELDRKDLEKALEGMPSHRFGRMAVSNPKEGLMAGQALVDAYKAGRKAQDTGAFEGWLKKSGLSSRSPMLRGELRAEFRRGVQDSVVTDAGRDANAQWDRWMIEQKKELKDWADAEIEQSRERIRERMRTRNGKTRKMRNGTEISAGGIRTVGNPGSKMLPPVLDAKLATVVVNSNNEKTGPCTGSYAAQASCPDGKNSSYRCPLLGSGCYAESGNVNLTTSRLNKAAGFTYTGGSKTTTPEDVARSEAAAFEAAYKDWLKSRGPVTKHHAVRIHVVGDCCTPESARILSKAVEPYYQSIPNGGSSIWAYTHAWMDVPRSAWSSKISILASCDTVGDAKKAMSRGWAVAMVIQRYVMREGKSLGAAVPLTNGMKMIPCPFEVGRHIGKKDVKCVDCKLCWKEDFLRKNKAFIAFAAHGKTAEKRVQSYVDIEPLIQIEAAPAKKNPSNDPELNMRPGDDSYVDVLTRLWGRKSNPNTGDDGVELDIDGEPMDFEAVAETGEPAQTVIETPGGALITFTDPQVPGVDASSHSAPVVVYSQSNPRGSGWYVKWGREKVAGPFESRDVALASLRLIEHEQPMANFHVARNPGLWDRGGSGSGDFHSWRESAINAGRSARLVGGQGVVAFRRWWKGHQFSHLPSGVTENSMRDAFLYGFGSKNPMPQAEQLFEKFHGREPSKILEYEEEVNYHGNLTELGDLAEIKVPTLTGLDVTLCFLTEEQRDSGQYPILEAVKLCSNELGDQLYFVGGDQSLPLSDLGMGEGTKWFRDSIIIGVLSELTYRTEKGFDKFQLTEYYHALGEETGEQPMLVYDTMNSRISVAGGQYKILPQGIVN